MENLSEKLSHLEPRAELLPKIMTRIGVLERRRLLHRLVIKSIVLVISLAALVPTVNLLRSEFAQSGVMQFISIVFTDPASVLGIWQELGLSILEAVPAVSLALVLTAVAATLGSARAVVRTTALAFAGGRSIES